MSSSSQQDTVFDLVGLGFGPANIAIAGALTEHWTENKVRSVICIMPENVTNDNINRMRMPSL